MTYESDLEQIKELDEAWNRAYLGRDPQALDRLLADDWVGLTADHKVITKRVLLEGQRRASAEAVMTFTRGDVWVFGDAAVTTGSIAVSAPCRHCRIRLPTFSGSRASARKLETKPGKDCALRCFGPRMGLLG